MTTNNKTGVLLTNIGTPDHLTEKAVQQFLKEFLLDKRVVEIPRFFWLPFLYGYILNVRPKQSLELYKKIWTDQGSPLLIYSEKIVSKLEKKIQMPVAIGMNYGNPSIESAMDNLRFHEVEKIFVLPLFPQYSATTTGASYDSVNTVLKKWRKLPSMQFYNQYAENKEYINALVKSIQKFWEKHSRAPHLLFSFHGIPERFVAAGDPYPNQCYATATAVAEKLNLKSSEWSLSFQSRLGRFKWLMPYTENMFKELPERGITHLQVICPGFATECLETLEEIAIRGEEQFMHAGGKQFEYIPALNDSPEQIDLLAKIVWAEV